MNFLLKHCEICKANLSTKSISELLGNGKITQCSKSCSKRKKVARNTKSCQKVAEQLVESPTGAHPDGHQHGDRKPTLKHWQLRFATKA